MVAIRLPRKQWGPAWRAMIEIGPVRLVAKDPICEVLPAHLELLDSKGIPYEIINRNSPRKEKRRRASSD